ncbi:MAG: hypothetical protein GY830_01900 [Bacteroidetes bacterium]|nr:hypothetical protein [Bacteroidota bacterium]
MHINNIVIFLIICNEKSIKFYRFYDCIKDYFLEFKFILLSFYLHYRSKKESKIFI